MQSYIYGWEREWRGEGTLTYPMYLPHKCDLVHISIPLQIWVSSGHNGTGYYGLGEEMNDAVSLEHFHATSNSDPGVVYARTGYLGFMQKLDKPNQDGSESALVHSQCGDTQESISSWHSPSSQHSLHPHHTHTPHPHHTPSTLTTLLPPSRHSSPLSSFIQPTTTACLWLAHVRSR